MAKQDSVWLWVVVTRLTVAASVIFWGVSACTERRSGAVQTGEGGNAPAAFLTAAPNPAEGTGPTGTTTIAWNTGDGSSADLFVATGDGPEQRMASGSEGTRTVDWIAADNSYRFALYSGPERERLLASVTVSYRNVDSSVPSTLFYASLTLLAVLAVHATVARWRARGDPRAEAFESSQDGESTAQVPLAVSGTRPARSAHAPSVSHSVAGAPPESIPAHRYATLEEPNIAVLIPCYQEERTIGKVVEDFRKALPTAAIYVFDNNCTDRTAEVAAAAGALVRRENKQGKGFVVAAMFDRVDADIYVMVDGDGTYDAASVGLLLEPILNGDADITVASRLGQFEGTSFPRFHIAGNRLICAAINWMFDSDVGDIFSGYRAFTKEAVRLIPITARGFDVETELTLQALYRGLVIKEIYAPYGTRPEGSYSKLKTGSDGILVLLKLFLMMRSYKPLTFFGGASFVLMALGGSIGLGPVLEFVGGGFVRSVPSAVLAMTLLMLSAFSLGLGLVLNSVNLRLLEVEMLIRKTRP